MKKLKFGKIANHSKTLKTFVPGFHSIGISTKKLSLWVHFDHSFSKVWFLDITYQNFQKPAKSTQRLAAVKEKEEFMAAII